MEIKNHAFAPTDLSSDKRGIPYHFGTRTG